MNLKIYNIELVVNSSKMMIKSKCNAKPNTKGKE